MVDKVDLTKLHVEIPDFYKYNEAWCDENIGSVYDLDVICKTRDAGFYLCKFLYETGEEFFQCIKIFNRKVKRLTEEKIQKMLKNYDFTNLKSDITFVGLDDDMSFENEDLMQEIDDFFEQYHVELAPDIYVEAANDIKDMVGRAFVQIRLTIDYIESLEEEYEALEYGEYDEDEDDLDEDDLDEDDLDEDYDLDEEEDEENF